MPELLRILSFLAANKVVLATLAGVAALYALIWRWALAVDGPRDTTGNGITIGRPKAFDNRSLQLRIERLSTSLANLKVVNQNVTENLATIQKDSTTSTSRSVTVDAKAPPPAKAGDDAATSKKEDKGTASESATAENKQSDKPTVALAASDILSDQLNLASQILNLETLYERSLTDRLIGKESRLQTVLGFQVSINPPKGCENSVAIVEVAVRLLGGDPISLVALIPQEKTYNSQTVSTSSQSIGGSAVASVLNVGFSSKGESRQLFIHRDSDTIAFERDAGSRPTIFENDANATVFGWEFRPVLGRPSVSAGTRQMLAVIAVPIVEFNEQRETILQIRTRSYWRRFNPRTQTTGSKWGLIPWNVNQSLTNDSPIQRLIIPNTARIQAALAPEVTNITWVNSGAGRATVIVTGKNFFSGTKVVIDGVVHREEDGNLTLKSSQALEFETSIASLVTGDCVLSGRFGSSFKFTRTTDKRITALTITQAVIDPSSFTKEVYMTIDLKGLDEDGKEVDLEVKDIQKLPEPILFVGAEAIKMPYDYFDIEPASEEVEETTAAAISAEPDGSAVVDGQPTPSELDSAKNVKRDPPTPAREKKFVRVGAWIPKNLASSPSVAFQVPFCGFEYQTSWPLSYAEPTVTKLGSDDEYCVFRIASPVGFVKPFRVELDKSYEEGCPELQKTSAVDYRFRVPTRIAQKYQHIVLRPGSGDPYLSPISVEDTATPPATLMTTVKPPQIKKGTIGPVEWSGTALENVTAVTLITGCPPAGSQSSTAVVRSAADFTTYDAGKKIEVYFKPENTSTIGKAVVEFVMAGGEIRLAPLLIIKDDAV